MKSFDEMMLECEASLNGLLNPYHSLYLPDEDRSKFPKEILKLDLEDRLNYWDKELVIHDHLQKMYEDLTRYIQNPTRPIAMVVGPARIGKTTLLENVVRKMLLRQYDALKKDRGIIPVGWTEVVRTTDGKFNWVSFYKQILVALNEPLIDQRPPKGQTQKEYYFNRVISALKNRSVQVFLIDEGQHLFLAQDAQAQMDHIKSISNLAKKPIVLFGTYEMAEFTQLSEQLSKRTDDFHFMRYQHDEKDFRNFKAVVGSFENLLPVEVTPNLRNHAEKLYRNSAGCIGSLKTWLADCLQDAHYRGENTISIDCLIRNEEPEYELINTMVKIMEGEARFLTSEEKKKQMDESYAQFIGAKPRGAGKGKDGGDGPKPPTRPGTRNSNRDSTDPKFQGSSV